MAEPAPPQPALPCPLAPTCRCAAAALPPPCPGLDHRHFDKIKQYLGETLTEMGVKQVGSQR